MQPVESGHIKQIGYDLATKTLRVDFKKGAGKEYYTYDNVSEEEHAEVMAAESVGQSFNRLIRNNPEKHPARKWQVSA